MDAMRNRRPMQTGGFEFPIPVPRDVNLELSILALEVFGGNIEIFEESIEKVNVLKYVGALLNI